MDPQTFALLKTLAAGALLPALLGAAVARWALRPPASSGALALGIACGLLSGVAGILTGGLVADARALPLVHLVGAARMVPPGEMERAVAPHLMVLSHDLAAREGRRPGPEETAADVQRMLGVLTRARGLSERELPGALPGILGDLVRSRERPGLLEHLTWSPQLDGALVVPFTAALAGGPIAGLAAGAIGAAARAQLLGTPWPLLLPTLLAGAIGALFGRGVRQGRLGPRSALALGAVLALAQSLWAALLAPPGAIGPDTLAGALVLAGVHASALSIVVMMLRLHGLEAVRQRLERAEVQARLELLTAQVRPHFLFNALNTIASSADDPSMTRRLIGCLARFLRLSLKPSAGLVRLADELADLETYLELERARWPDRLVVDVACAPAAGDAHIPPLLVQPLIENAISHGFRAAGELLTVTVRARIDGTDLIVDVEDDGAGAPAPRLAALTRGEGLGIGLASVLGRARALEPPGRVVFGARSGGGLSVQLTIPRASPVPA